MQYLDKNGNAHNSAASMRLADIRSTNVIEATKEIPNKLRDRVADIINSRPNFGDKYNNSAEDLMFEEDDGCNLEEVENISSEESHNLPEVCISKEAPEKGTITNIWYNIDLMQWQFEEAGNPSIVIKTLDEMTPEFSNRVYNKADDSLRRGENLLVNLMFSVANEDLPDLAKRSINSVNNLIVNPRSLDGLIDSHASISLRVVAEVPPQAFGTISDGMGNVLTSAIVALQTASSHIRRIT